MPVPRDPPATLAPRRNRSKTCGRSAAGMPTPCVRAPRGTAQRRPRLLARQPDRDRAAVRAVLDRVGEQVVEHPLEPPGPTRRPARVVGVGAELAPSVVRWHRRGPGPARPGRSAPQPLEAADRLEAGQVQQLVDQPPIRAVGPMIRADPPSSFPRPGRRRPDAGAGAGPAGWPSAGASGRARRRRRSPAEAVPAPAGR